MVLAYFNELGYSEIARLLGIERSHVAVFPVPRQTAASADVDRSRQVFPMKCPSDLTIMMRADEELDEPESVRVDEHIGGCARCRELLFTMRAERHVLAAALHEAVADRRAAAEADAIAVRRWSDGGSLGAAVLLVVALAVATLSHGLSFPGGSVRSTRPFWRPGCSPA